MYKRNFTYQQDVAVEMALSQRLDWIKHNIAICAKLQEPSYSKPMTVFMESYADTLGALNVLHTPDFIPKYPTDEEMTF